MARRKTDAEIDRDNENVEEVAGSIRGAARLAGALLRAGGFIGALAMLGGCGSSLGDYAWRGNEAGVRKLLERGADPNSTDDSYGSPPLLGAVRGCYAGIVKMLLDKGADPNAKNETSTVLGDATLCDPNVVKLLLDKGANPNLMPPHGHAALYLAVEQSLQSGTTPDAMESRQHAVEKIRLLVVAGADPLADGVMTLAEQRHADQDVITLLESAPTAAAANAARDKDASLARTVRDKAFVFKQSFEEVFGSLNGHCQSVHGEVREACLQAMALLESSRQHATAKQFDAALDDLVHAQEAVNRGKQAYQQSLAQQVAEEAPLRAAEQEADVHKAIPMLVRLCKEGNEDACTFDRGCVQSHEVATVGHRINTNSNVRAVTSSTVISTFELCKQYCAEGLPGACVTVAGIWEAGGRTVDAQAMRARACQLGFRGQCSPSSSAANPGAGASMHSRCAGALPACQSPTLPSCGPDGRWQCVQVDPH